MSAPESLRPGPPLRRADDGAVCTLTLDRPAQFNALSEALLDALQSELDDLHNTPEIRVVVLRANGRAFCAGHDLKEMRLTPEEEYYQSLFARCGRVMQSIVALPQPVIAVVQGTATAAGCQLVATCDLAIAADTARFAVSGINVGLFCSTPAVALSRNITRKRAFEMLMTGDFIDADKAMDWGLINRVVPPERLDEAVTELVEKILSKSGVAVRTGKQMFYRQLEQGLASAYTYAGDVMACNMMSADTAEGIDAFIEKRPAGWRHR